MVSRQGGSGDTGVWQAEGREQENDRRGTREAEAGRGFYSVTKPLKIICILNVFAPCTILLNAKMYLMYPKTLLTSLTRYGI